MALSDAPRRPHPPITKLLFRLREERLALVLVVGGGDDPDRKIEERGELRREREGPARFRGSVPREHRLPEVAVVGRRDQERRRHAPRESVRVAPHEIPAVRRVRPARSDRREPAALRLLLEDLRYVAFLEHELELDARLLRPRLERRQDRASGGYEGLPELAGEVQKRLEADRSGQVRDDDAVQERAIDDVDAAHEASRGAREPERVREGALRVGRAVEADREARERHEITTPAYPTTEEGSPVSSPLSLRAATSARAAPIARAPSRRGLPRRSPRLARAPGRPSLGRRAVTHSGSCRTRRERPADPPLRTRGSRRLPRLRGRAGERALPGRRERSRRPDGGPEGTEAEPRESVRDGARRRPPRGWARARGAGPREPARAARRRAASARRPKDRERRARPSRCGWGTGRPLAAAAPGGRTPPPRPGRNRRTRRAGRRLRPPGAAPPSPETSGRRARGRRDGRRRRVRRRRAGGSPCGNRKRNRARPFGLRVN